MKKTKKRLLLTLLLSLFGAFALVACDKEEEEEPATPVAKYTVTFDVNGGALAEGAASSKELEIGQALGELPTPTNANGVFGGWYDGETLVAAETAAYTQNVTLTAKWLQVQTMDTVELHLNRTDRSSTYTLGGFTDTDGNALSDITVGVADTSVATLGGNTLTAVTDGSTSLTVVWQGVRFENVATVEVYSWQAIASEAELDTVRENLDGSYYLTSNITGAGEFAMIAPVDGENEEFTGRFDGCGYQLGGYSVTDYWWGWNGGLFGTIGATGVVENLSVSVASPETAVKCWGGIAAINKGTVRNCFVDITLTHGAPTGYYAGAIVGKNDITGTIESCIASVNGTGATGERFASVAGLNQGAVVNAYALSEVYGAYCRDIGASTNVCSYIDMEYFQNLADVSVFPSTAWGKPQNRLPVLLNADRAELVVFDTLLSLNDHPDAESNNVILAYDRDYNLIASGLSFESSDTTVATVSDNGEITVTGSGTATITVIKGADSVEVTVDCEHWKAISSYADWCAIATNEDYSSNFYLTADIDGEGATAPQIGGYDTNTSRPSFTGRVDGRGYTLKNVGIDVDPWKHNGGLFDMFGGVIENLSLEINAPTGTLKSFGLLVNQNSGIIRNCKLTVAVTTGNVNGVSSAGALVRANNGLIENCIVVATGSVEAGQYFASIAGANTATGKIRNVYAVSPFAACGQDVGAVANQSYAVYATEAELLASVTFDTFDRSLWTVSETALPALKK